VGIRILFLLAFITAGMMNIEAFGQDCYYQSPVSGPIISSGSYGEPRTAHFHAGIDFKQRKGIPFDTIFAVESGFISRIVIRPDGYGNALYIDHPCGQTSVYAHLYEFAPHITTFAHDLMYKKKSYTLNEHIAKSKIKVNKGEAIGIMGSTGRSSGPHLHFEIRNTASEKSTNPALYNLKPKDNIPPVIRGVVIYTLTPDGQELQSEYYPAFMNKKGEYQLSNYALRSGSLLVGIGIHTYDTMNGAKNHNGIYAAELKVDGESEFRFKLDSLAFNTSRYIHSHMDYGYKVANRYVTKLFRNPWNPLDIYGSKTKGGEISLYEATPRQVEIRVFDIDRNRAELSFEIRRNESLAPYPIGQNKDQIRISPDQDWEKTGVNTTIIVPKEAVAAPVFMQLQSDFTDSIVLKQPHEIALFKPLVIEQKIVNRIHPKEKYILSSLNKRNELQSCN